MRENLAGSSSNSGGAEPDVQPGNYNSEPHLKARLREAVKRWVNRGRLAGKVKKVVIRGGIHHGQALRGDLCPHVTIDVLGEDDTPILAQLPRTEPEQALAVICQPQSITCAL
ncbi:hypothetical protein M407DRAFT_128093 [Tulasnella calospora MUT 4182]|uniref:Uncharacterized protein n=1 Tax=Tulasnella calospora MUT 4182 TaxID=1051891 RepID=A0A0C3LK22_9AGAM|nr:hypothetical protein M407DRAFT_128093 [Tulasnella calospora MUT 4182]